MLILSGRLEVGAGSQVSKSVDVPIFCNWAPKRVEVIYVVQPQKYCHPKYSNLKDSINAINFNGDILSLELVYGGDYKFYLKDVKSVDALVTSEFWNELKVMLPEEGVEYILASQVN